MIVTFIWISKIVYKFSNWSYSSHALNVNEDNAELGLRSNKNLNLLNIPSWFSIYIWIIKWMNGS